MKMMVVVGGDEDGGGWGPHFEINHGSSFVTMVLYTFIVIVVRVVLTAQKTTKFTNV